MDILFGASILASFVAGMIALFAPCCITVLLPAYCASVFREKKNIVWMTFLFFGGIATILIPIGLGAAFLAQIFRDFHNELWILGGAFMLILAVLSLQGKGLAIPLPAFMRKDRLADGAHPVSVYFIGILSGAATSCCAPVLAGAMTLAIASGSFAKALVVVSAYVFGMTFPLFAAAYFYDRYKIENSSFVQGRFFTFPFFGKRITIHSTNLLASAMFFLIGGTMFVLGMTDNAYWSPEHQESLGFALSGWSQTVLTTLSVVPDAVWGVGIAGLFIFLAYSIRRKKTDHTPCH